MASYPIPPWLQAQNPAPFFLQGVNQGADIAAQQNASDRAAATMQMQRAQMEQQQRMEAFNAAQKAVQLQMSVDEQRRQRELDQARLVGITQENQAKAQEMAGRMRFQQEFGKRVASGVDPSEALFQTLPMAPLSVAAPMLQRMQANKSIQDRMDRYRALAVGLNPDTATTDDIAKAQFERNKVAKIRGADAAIVAYKAANPEATEDELSSIKAKLYQDNAALKAPETVRKSIDSADLAAQSLGQVLEQINTFEGKFGKGSFDKFIGPIDDRLNFMRKNYTGFNSKDEKLVNQVFSTLAQTVNKYRHGEFGGQLTEFEGGEFAKFIASPSSHNFRNSIEAAYGKLGDDVLRQLENYKMAPNISDTIRKRYEGKKPGAWFGASEEPVPAPAQRKAGETYPTPRGRLKWTGTGWVKP